MARYRLKLMAEGRGFEPVLLKREGIEAESVRDVADALDASDLDLLPDPRHVDLLKVEIRRTGE